MKKLFAIVIATMMLMALSITAFADYTMTATSGQDFDGKVLADGVELAGDWYADKLSTSWVNSAEFDAILAALQEEGSVVTLTYKGEITAIGFQSSVGENKVTDLTVTTDGDVSTATVAGSALLSDASILEGYDWCNLMVEASAGTVLTGFTVTTGGTALAVDAEPAPEAETPPADEAEAPVAEAETPATESEAPATTETESAPAPEAAAPATGIALCLIPAVIALGAVAIAKKH